MRVFVAVVIIAGLLDASVSGEDSGFGNTRVFDKRGELHKGELVFRSADQQIVVREKNAELHRVSYASIQSMVYDYSSRHRGREAAAIARSATTGDPLSTVVLSPVWVSLALGTWISKEKKHWFFVNYTDAEGAPRQLALWLHKKKYKQVLEVARREIGREVTILPEEGAK